MSHFKKNIQGTQQKKLWIYQWVRLVKALFPEQTTHNPFAQQLAHLDFLTWEERLLLEDVLHGLTLLNSHSRIRSSGAFITSQSDFLNAVNMIVPESLQLESKAISFHERLLETFHHEPFTYYEVSSKLNVSIKTITRRLKPLVLRKLVMGIKDGENRKRRFQAQPFEEAEIADSRTIFETMQGEWKDFEGFVEL